MKYGVLFLCTGNSARSILAEALLRHWGGENFSSHSAGSQPKGQVHPYALDLLAELKLPRAGLRSKSWDEFARPGAPAIDIVITVCDNAAAEACPVWPGAPINAHWGIPDPAAVTGSQMRRRQAFRDALARLEARIKPLIALPVATLDRAELRRRIAAIGEDAVRRDTRA